LAALAAAAGATAIGYALARELDAGARGPGALATGALAGQLPALLAGLGALALAGYGLGRRRSPGFGLALAGAALAILAGLGNVDVFGQAVAPTPGPSWWARVAVLVVVGAGAGLAVAGVLRLRARTVEPGYSSGHD
jgi:hypothetical protein